MLPERKARIAASDEIVFPLPRLPPEIQISIAEFMEKDDQINFGRINEECAAIVRKAADSVKVIGTRIASIHKEFQPSNIKELKCAGLTTTDMNEIIRKNLKSNELPSEAACATKLESDLDVGPGQLPRTVYFPKLEKLDLSECKDLNDRSLIVLLSRCPNLRAVDFTGCRQLTDATAKALPNFPDLHKVNLSSSQITDTAPLSLCRNLRVLNLRRCHKLTDAKVEALSSLPDLLDLDLSVCFHLTDATAVSLARCSRLHTLKLQACQKLTDAAVVSLSRLSDLHTLDLSWCDKLTDAAVATMSRCPNLRDIDLRECPQVTDTALDRLGTDRPDIKIRR